MVRMVEQLDSSEWRVPVFPRLLNTSSLLCDCHLQWLAQWLTKHAFQRSVMAACSHPAGLLDRSILSLLPEQLVCGEFLLAHCMSGSLEMMIYLRKCEYSDIAYVTFESKAWSLSVASGNLASAPGTSFRGQELRTLLKVPTVKWLYCRARTGEFPSTET